jgi:hypothetical protein
MDDTLFGALTEGGKRWCGTEKATVVIGLSLYTAGHPKYVKIQVTSDVSGPTLKALTRKALETRLRYTVTGSVLINL